jgi:Arc/MetJ family transcription regulator
MKKTLNIDEEMLQQAKKACGASTDTETVRLGLEALILQSAYQRLRRLRGSEKTAVDVPRRRTSSGTKRNAA